MPDINHNDLDGGSVVSRRNAGFAGRIGVVVIGILLAAGLAYINWPDFFGHDTLNGDDEFGTGQSSVSDLRPSFEQSEAPATLASPSANVDQTVEAGRDLDAERRLLEQKMREAEEARLREEARQKAEAERLRREKEQQALWERLRSSQIITDATEAARPDNAMSLLPDGQLVPVPGADTDANKAFLAQAEAHSNAMAKATRNQRTDALIAEGTVIRGFLETAINTDLPGLVRAVVRENVRSLDGRRILIPKGARLVGEYKSGLEQGQTRVFIVWNRIIRTDGVSVDIGSPGADNLGRAGMPGRVDKHWLQRFGSAIMLSVIDSGIGYVSSLGNKNNSGTQITVNTGPQAAGSATSSLGKIAEQDFKRASKIPPTIHVDQGSPVVILVHRDLDFSELYADPVQQELARLRRGGRPRRAIDPVPLYMTPKDNWFPPIPEN
ncbi:conjugal transfer protein [Phyllobacterium phragmitis]|uniref:Conjugal transfer protein n=1 Tax=Phyllobacterium phragmitis TaxID=2670329 RepID=A0A2S9ITG6_9HYPH|nr:type IV secretion system protein VirB10 [Phyllobacterium phragmitis]PRD43808.1 conjugal transfer protein [Phyllobacterium phragmitis]